MSIFDRTFFYLCGINIDDFRTDWWNEDEAIEKYLDETSIFEEDEPYEGNRRSFLYFIHFYIISSLILFLLITIYYLPLISSIVVSLAILFCFRAFVSEGCRIILTSILEIQIFSILILISIYNISSM